MYNRVAVLSKMLSMSRFGKGAMIVEASALITGCKFRTTFAASDETTWIYDLGSQLIKNTRRKFKFDQVCSTVQSNS